MYLPSLVFSRGRKTIISHQISNENVQNSVPFFPPAKVMLTFFSRTASSHWHLFSYVCSLQVLDVESREDLIKNHYMARIVELTSQLQLADSKSVHFYAEVSGESISFDVFFLTFLGIGSLSSSLAVHQKREISVYSCGGSSF